MLKQRGEKKADGKWSIPAAERNKGAILDVLARVLPERGVAPWSATLALLEGAKALLSIRHILYLYGPYRRFGRHTSVSNEQFDSDLRAHDPEWGLRDLEAVSEAAASSGFLLAEIVEMPANNFSLIFKRT